MARKREVLSPSTPLFCMTTLHSKTNTTANIGVKCLHFSRNVMLSVGVSHMGKTRVVFIDPGAKVNSSYYCSIVLEEGLLPDIRAICRHYSLTVGHCSSMERQRTSPGPRWTIWKKSTSTSLNLTCGLLIALILIPWITLFGVLFSIESTTNDNSRRWKNCSERWSPIGKNSHSVSQYQWMAWTSWSCYQEWRRTHRAIETWLEQPHIILILSRDKFSQ